MSLRRWGRTIGPLLVTMLLLSAVPGIAVADPPTGTCVGLQGAASPRVVFTFGKPGDNLRPLALTIDDTGKVAGFYMLEGRPSTQVHPQVRLSQDAVAGLVKLAQAEGFFTMPRVIGRAIIGSSARFITVHTTATERTVMAWTGESTAFNQLYAVLLAVSGVPATPIRATTPS